MGGRDLAGLPSRVERFIGDDLRQVEQIFRQELESQNPYVADIFAHVAHFRGKRLRPMLLLTLRFRRRADQRGTSRARRPWSK